MNKFNLRLIFIILAVSGQVHAQEVNEVKRPKITGVAHIALYTKSITQSRAFYKDFLGFAEPYSVNQANSDQLALFFIKINDRQFVEVFPEKTPETERFYHFSIETNDAEGMRRYLASKGYKVPGKTPTGKTGNLNYTVKDPNGIGCEFVQYTPTGFTMKDLGKNMPDTRISKHMTHVGIMVANLDSAMKFYKDVLGFTETWRGSSNGKILSWVNMKVPDGDDYIEFMLYDKEPSADRKGTMNHICLVVDNVAASGKILQSRKLPDGCKPPTELKTGINRKRQINYYDGDGTRIEIMEPGTVDGLPVPPSAAPAPKFIKIDTLQLPISRRSWKFVATQMPDSWYGSEESKAVAENVLLYQRSVGGWPKNIPMHRPLSDSEKANQLRKKDTLDAILDNDATTTEMKFLARMYNKTGIEKYKSSFFTGLNYLLKAQYENGGWPMFYPLRKGYYTHINFNDNCIVNIMELLKDIYNRVPLYKFVADNETIAGSKKAFDKGLDCIFKTQIVVKGEPTIWCAQHDEYNFTPAKARSYELPSFSGGESTGIIKLLMELPDPSPAVVRSVQGAVKWLDVHRIKNTRWESFINKDGLRDRRIITDPKAGDLWARFYDLDTQQPYVCDRDGIKKKTLEEIGYERRNGYSWYTDAPQEVFDLYPAWKAKWIK
jgi:PelA/Pel-15E family pectate lyase